jgi:Fic family protein
MDKIKPILKKIDQLKKEIDTLKPLKQQEIKEIRQYFKVGLTYSSNALEGNSLTESETKVVIEDGITVGGKPVKDHYEATGHAEAYEKIYTLMSKENITEEQIKELHHIFYYRINKEQAGKYRKTQAFISGSKYTLPLPEYLSQLMAQFVKDIGKIVEKEHPVISAAKVHKEFVFIHPFIDGNGRISRLLMNLILLKKGFTIAIIPSILRSQYIECLEKAHEDDTAFLQFIAETVKQTQEDYLRLFNRSY